jgi:HEAT repeat protein
LVRARGIDVLAQLGKTFDHPSNSFPEESYSVVSSLIEHESELQPLASAIAALGHLDNPLAIPLIVRYRAHPSEEIRFRVAWALGCFPNDPRSVTTLLALMEDAEEDVRDWATFGLGNQGESDSSVIRDALFRRLGDSNEDVREEAIAGLAKRQDKRVLPALLAALERSAATNTVIEAACQLLEMENHRKDWDPRAYAAALQRRFGI